MPNPPNAGENPLELARIHYQHGRFDQAEPLFRLLLQSPPARLEALQALAWIAFRLRKFDEAIDLMRRAAEEAPSAPDLWNGLGIIQIARHEPVAAESSFHKAVSLREDYPEAWVNLGNALRNQGRWGEAAAAYHRATALRPKYAVAFHALAIALRELGRIDDSLAAINEAIRLAPTFELHNDRAGTLIRADRLLEAEAALNQSLQLQPRNAKAHRHLSLIAARRLDFPAAVTHLQSAIAIDGPSPRDRFHLGIALAHSQRHREAIEQFRASIETEPANARAHANLGLSLEAVGDAAGARASFENAHRLDDADEMIRYHLAALEGVDPPAAMPATYVVELFDDYSQRFDAHLVEKLHYRGPELLLEATRATSTLLPDARLDIVDLGCGTGLCGKLFKPIARSLVGVDLSPRMISLARATGLYDVLEQTDLVPSLERRRGAVDLILAADVFIYVGDLHPLFTAARDALRPGGRIAFTLELFEGAEFTLQRNRRYAHSRAYIQRLAQIHGFDVIHDQTAALRDSESGSVQCGVIVVRKSDPK